MSDLVERLRAGICDDPCRVRDIPSGCACAEAADRIAQLEAALRAILAVSSRHNKPTFNVITDCARAALGDK